MKMQITFDMTDLDKALLLASQVSSYADILEVGSLLIYKYGDRSISAFKEQFPQKTILADSKIVDRGKEAAQLLVQAGADWITVMAGTAPNIIRNACIAAHEQNKKVMLDLLDSSSLGQSALEAQSLGVDALVAHRPAGSDEQLMFLDKWEIIKGNTQLPIFISATVTRETIKEIVDIKPSGIIIGKEILQAADPVEEAAFYYDIVNKA